MTEKRFGRLITTLDELRVAVEPILAGQVPEAAFDTETTEILDERFTPYGTESRIAGFSVSYDDPSNVEVDFYAPIRHRPYDWRRRFDLVPEDWRRRLQEDEGVTSSGTWAEGWDPNLPKDGALEILQETFEAAETRWAGHNWAFDGSMVDADGVEPPWDRIEETQFLSIYTDTRPIDAWDDGAKKFVHGGHALKHLGETYLGVERGAEDLVKLARKVLQCNDYSLLPLRTILAPYACLDTRLTLQLLRHCRARPTFDEKAQALYESERRLIRHIVALMRRGIRVRPELAQQFGQHAEERLAEIVTKTNDLAGQVLPYGNGEKLGEVLYQDLAMPKAFGKGDTRGPTLKQVRARLPDDEAGRKLRAIVDGVLAYRTTHKELTAFYRPLQTFGEDGILHPLVRQMAAVTTRMSVAKPNVQQVKKKGDVRRAFVPRDGFRLGFADYDQIEMRISAHYSKVLPEAFQSLFTWNCTLAKRGDCKGRKPHGPRDDEQACRKVVHTGRRPQWHYKPPKLYLYEGFMTDPDFDPYLRFAEITEESRDVSKTATLALLYGAWYVKLAETLDCPVDHAKMLHSYFWDQAWPELAFVREFIAERLRRVGTPTKISGAEYLRTLKGARIYLEGSYKGLNQLVQRSAREVFGEGYLAVADWCERETGGAYVPISPTHDEIVFEVDKQSDDPAAWRQIVDLMMAAGAECRVPLTVGVEISDTSWHKDERDEVEV